MYLIAFGPLREVFSTRELRLLAESMAERRIRMRVGLEEVVGDWTDNVNRAREEMGESQSGDEDEIEELEDKFQLDYQIGEDLKEKVCLSVLI